MARSKSRRSRKNRGGNSPKHNKTGAECKSVLGKGAPMVGKDKYWAECDTFFDTHKIGQEGALYSCDKGRPTVEEYKAGETCMTPRFGCKGAVSGKYFSTGEVKSDYKNKKNINIQDLQSLAKYNALSAAMKTCDLHAKVGTKGIAGKALNLAGSLGAMGRKSFTRRMSLGGKNRRRKSRRKRKKSRRKRKKSRRKRKRSRRRRRR